MTRALLMEIVAAFAAMGQRRSLRVLGFLAAGACIVGGAWRMGFLPELMIVLTFVLGFGCGGGWTAHDARPHLDRLAALEPRVDALTEWISRNGDGTHAGKHTLDAALAMLRECQARGWGPSR